MFDQWKLPDNICDTNPINKKNLENFIGRKQQSQRILKFLNSSNRTVILIEGDIGVGKTSLGNYVRLQPQFFSPTFEIKSNVNWTQKDILNNIISKILQELYIENDSLIDSKQLNNLKMNKKINDLYIRYNNSFILGMGAGGWGFQGNFEKGDVSRPNDIPEDTLFTDLALLTKIIRDELNLKHPIVLQLNNLDRSYLFKNQELSTIFFDNLRDVLQIDNISWILSGETGLKDFLKINNPRLFPIINHSEHVLPLNFEDFLLSFDNKIKNFNEDGYIPLEKDVLFLLYDKTNGSLREFLGLVNKILTSFEDIPFKKTITKQDVIYLFFQEKEELLNFLYEKYKWSKKILGIIIKNPEINQTKLAKELGITRQALIKQTELLTSDKINALKEIKNGKASVYKIDTEIYFALQI